MQRLTRILLSVALALFATFASADVLCTEDPVGGCVASIPTTSPLIYVASDGESAFNPFGITVDVSDAIDFGQTGWTLNNAYGGFNAGFWTQWSDTVWYLPASTPCGNENEPGCEPWGAWTFIGGGWIPGTPGYLSILEADGSISDEIILFNDANGNANLIFASDPNLYTPEPGSLALLGSGLFGLAGVIRRKYFA